MITIVKRYAKGFLEAIPEGKVKAVLEEYEELLKSFEKEDLYFILKNPEIDKRKKKAFLRELFSFSSGNYLLNLLLLLIEKERILLLEHIFREVQKLYLEKQNIRQIMIEVVHPLTDSEKKEIANWFLEKMQVRVELKEKINPELLGGMKIYYQDLVLDASLAGRIKHIYQKIIEE